MKKLQTKKRAKESLKRVKRLRTKKKKRESESGPLGAKQVFEIKKHNQKMVPKLIETQRL